MSFQPPASDAEHFTRDWDWWSNFLQREYYGSDAERSGWQDAAADVARAVGLQPGMRVIDLGSGCGEMVLQLALRGADVVGVEQSQSLVDFCRLDAVDRGIVAEFVAVDMFDFEPDRPADVVLSLNTSFGYGSDERNRALIGKIGQWLKPGGALYFDAFTADHARAFGQWTDQVAGGTLIVDNHYEEEDHMMISQPAWISPDYSSVYMADSPERVILYTREELESMMREAGLHPRRLRRAMGRRHDQSDDEPQSTWIATRGDDPPQVNRGD